MDLVCHVILQDHVIKGLCYFIGGSWRYNVFSMLRDFGVMTPLTPARLVSFRSTPLDVRLLAKYGDDRCYGKEHINF